MFLIYAISVVAEKLNSNRYVTLLTGILHYNKKNDDYNDNDNEDNSNKHALYFAFPLSCFKHC